MAVTPETEKTADRPDRSGVTVQLVGLTRLFGPTRALDGLSIDIQAGEFVAFLGPSGCGKTTALRIIAGLDEADSGEVLVDGKDIGSLPASRRDMGMVFQAYSLFPNMTARNNVAFGLRMRKIDKATRQRRADEMLELVGLGAMADRYPNQLSGGQQQRVALARALAIRPRVLLLDEPLSALDAKVRGELRDEIRRVHQEVGTTTVFVTHDQEEAFTLADRVAVINNGRLQQIGPPTEIYEKPATEFVADFVGLTNRLPGVAGDGLVEVLGDRLPLLDGSAKDGDVTVLVRPESMQLAPSTDGNGWVTAVSFRGPISMVRVRLPGDELVLVQMPSADSSMLSPGTQVRLSVRPRPVLAVSAARADGRSGSPLPGDVSEPQGGMTV
ncbi:MAG TPA: ABC transporter ATP-binding protein [Thermoleophilia bacterium]|mgnify:FL=1|nr:ABC transporter ATP-binding protein [Acidobacteriota bacterium]HOU28550.1 ABC transporter ATP-binding protein [Thermoleophilia bacterium]HQF52981.1 ABC transporter ATP-binding protein [Thermoleophilia bacterium]HQH22005.1 ABC transporter ATP-binding protein [Thermoleophilia bacterium]HQJ27553.1 ABC transporter ATP-binding protein [Thermoleophilia bacterium]